MFIESFPCPVKFIWFVSMETIINASYINNCFSEIYQINLTENGKDGPYKMK